MSKEFYHRHHRKSNNPWRHTGQPNLLDDEMKKKAINRFFKEQGIRIPEEWPIPKICDAITTIHLMKRIPEENHAQYKFVRMYAQTGVPRYLLNREPFARDWQKLVDSGVYDPLTNRRIEGVRTVSFP